VRRRRRRCFITVLNNNSNSNKDDDSKFTVDMGATFNWKPIAPPQRMLTLPGQLKTTKKNIEK